MRTISTTRPAPRPTQRLRAATIALATVGALLVACGSDDADEPDAEDSAGDVDGPTTVTIAEVPGVPTAFLAYGVDLGLFEDEGIDLTIEGGGGSPAVAGVSSGSVDMAGSNVVSVIMARHQGLPVTMIAPGTFASEEPEDDFSAIVATDDSGIETVADLAGASIAVDQLQNIGEITIRTSLEESGVDTDTLAYVELGFPTMEQALRAGDVDAAWIIEPFATQALAAGGLHVVSYPYAETHPGLQIGSIITSEDYAAENPDVVSAFQRAHAATAAAITDDPEAFRTALVDLTDMDPHVASTFHLPTWNDAIDMDSLELINGQMITFGLLDEEVPLDELVHDAQ